MSTPPQKTCAWCELLIKDGDAIIEGVPIPQHRICGDIIQASYCASIDAYVKNHGCTPEEACAEIFSKAGVQHPPEWWAAEAAKQK